MSRVYNFSAGPAMMPEEVLEEIGIQNCDTVVVCIGEKIDTSILVTLNVVNLGVKRVIAKAISRDQGEVLEKIGADRVVVPEHAQEPPVPQRPPPFPWDGDGGHRLHGPGRMKTPRTASVGVCVRRN